MNKKSLLIIGGLIVVLIGLGIFFSPASQRSQLKDAITQPISNEPSPTQSGGAGTGGAPKTQVKPSISVTSPLLNAEWVTGQNHTISWSKEAGYTGSIYLIDATSKAVIGWINSNVGPRQTSFTWDTSQVFIGRNNPLKKNLSNGKYIIKVSFDGNQLPEVQSPVFSIIFPEQEKTTTQSIIIKDLKFTPETTIAKKGNLLNFTNNDSVVHKVFSQNFGSYTIQPGESISVGTLSLTVGSYEFQLDNLSVIGKLIIQ